MGVVWCETGSIYVLRRALCSHYTLRRLCGIRKPTLSACGKPYSLLLLLKQHKGLGTRDWVLKLQQQVCCSKFHSISAMLKQ